METAAPAAVLLGRSNHSLRTSTRQRACVLTRKPQSYISEVARKGVFVFRVDQSLRQDIERIAEDEQRTITQVCEMLLHEGVEAYKKEGSKFMQRLIAKQKLRTK